jgi:hypothetical protein
MRSEIPPPGRAMSFPEWAEAIVAGASRRSRSTRHENFLQISYLRIFRSRKPGVEIASDGVRNRRPTKKSKVGDPAGMTHGWQVFGTRVADAVRSNIVDKGRGIARNNSIWCKRISPTR